MSKTPGKSEIAAGPDRRRAAASPAVVRPLRLGTAERLVPQPQTSSSSVAHPLIWAATVLGAALVASVLLWQGANEEAMPPVTARGEVLAIEQMLDALAFTPGIVDGIADNATAAAIREFQRLAGLPEDGLATPALLEELRAVTRAE
ncbi:MAG: peptidoglycan-binding protein [Rhodospirillaceae bacterium]|nr:peptidoglycan-binding protein [Rhodospirillaceae bacterium]